MKYLPSRLTRRLIREERGAALVEFAVSSLLFISVAFGTMEFSRMIMDYNIVSNAAREGVRWAAVRGGNSGRTATTTAVQNYVVSRANGLLAPANVTVTWPVDNLVGSDVQVQVQYSFVPIASMLPSTAVNLSSTTRMTIVR